MKIVRYRDGDAASVGILEDDKVFPANATTVSEAMMQAGAGALSADKSSAIPLSDVELLAPVDPATKVLCVALNYQGHVNETGAAVPENPIIFFKVYHSMIGDGAEIHHHDVITQLDYEGELAVVIGKEGYDIPLEDAWSYVGGVSAFNDTSARNLLWVKAEDKVFLDWYSGKCLERSSPMGPAIVTKDELESELMAGQLRVQTRVNGEERQNAMTEELIFNIPELVSFCSTRVNLMPGDVIATGTPHGVGMASGNYLSSGDVVEIDITGIPVLTNKVA
ncbi:MAG: fumarylacetoacetate hydrolase family protein [Rhodospirillales bacterium]|jgi:2-keto-4-pentenoate hydratase/2-oxohepta-3-ene-1,7-dioic acid hydratase in catechol pathway|nr:fumarylacetoacetate hydrolase family protein [Rhodospirillales bacterium]